MYNVHVNIALYMMYHGQAIIQKQLGFSVKTEDKARLQHSNINVLKGEQ